MKYFIYAILGIVGIAVAAGFFIVGSPKEERLRRFDERRIQDLQFLQSEIVNYWQNKNRLPAKLSDIRDDIRGVAAPNDPETGVMYEYNVKKSETFELCATFNLSVSNRSTAAAPVTPPPGYPKSPFGENWDHASGHTCFERTIDKEFYKPTNPSKTKL